LKSEFSFSEFDNDNDDDNACTQDAENWMTLAEAVSPRCYIVGDHVYHRPGRLRSEDLPSNYKTSAVVLYLHHVTTVTDVLACVQKMTGELVAHILSL